MAVVATAGHVDHGKSTLVRALTGMEPDRWAEERRRGMTIDLGYAWTRLSSGDSVAFVDVPGHERFIGNMLAGIGPAPAVLFVVAADEGWSRQSSEHLAAVEALRIEHGLLVVTRSDLADPRPAVADARERLARTSLGSVPAVSVSGLTGAGLPDLRAALERLVAALPPADTGGRARLWVDRAFTARGSGTVVTGTLGCGRFAVGQRLDLASGYRRMRRVTVRALESMHVRADDVEAVARVAVNLRGVAVNDVGRGDALLTADAWRVADTLDVRLDRPATDLPEHLMLHAGTAAMSARLRPLAGSLARLRLSAALPVSVGDRAILRDPGRRTIVSGVHILDADPPQLTRRGAAARRGAALQTATGTPDVVMEVDRRRAVERRKLVQLGFLPDMHSTLPESVHEVHGWAVSAAQWATWCDDLPRVVDRYAAGHPLTTGMPQEAARRAVALPDARLLPAVAAAAHLVVGDGAVGRAVATRDLSSTASAIGALEERWRTAPFAAPEAAEVADLGLGRRQIAALVAEGLLLRLDGDTLLSPQAPDQAIAVLSRLPSPFTVSEARAALGTTRRVALPLLAYLDANGRTERIDDRLRRVSDGRRQPGPTR